MRPELEATVCIHEYRAGLMQHPTYDLERCRNCSPDYRTKCKSYRPVEDTPLKSKQTHFVP